jgi:DNA-binding transcriptional LysR family regulator
MRTFVKVAQLGSFTAAAAELYIAQQAVSQQVKSLEQALGVELLRRTPRAVTPTAAGEVFLQEAKRVLAAADRAQDRTRAAARGEVGTLRVAYTLTSAYETFPELQTALQTELPGVDVVSREVFGADVPALLLNGAFDLALAPRVPLTDGLSSQPLRAEHFVAALSEDHPLVPVAEDTNAAESSTVELGDLGEHPFELWPRHMAPGFYDAVVAACRTAGFEPRLDPTATGSVVWRTLADGRGVALVVPSLQSQLPRGVRLVPLRPPQPPPLHIDVIWPTDADAPAIERFTTIAYAVGTRERWL